MSTLEAISWARPGPDRVPADLVLRAPADRPRLHARLPDPSARFNDLDQLGTRARSPRSYFRGDLWRIAGFMAAGAARAIETTDERLWVVRSSSARSRSRSSALIFKDQIEPARAALLDRLGADPLLLVMLSPTAGTRSAGAGGDERPRRAGRSAWPRRWRWPRESRARGHDLRRSASAASTGSPPPATRSCSGPGRGRSGAFRGCARSASGGPTRRRRPRSSAPSPPRLRLPRSPACCATGAHTLAPSSSTATSPALLIFAACVRDLWRQSAVTRRIDVIADVLKERTARGSGPFAVTREESRESELRRGADGPW